MRFQPKTEQEIREESNRLWPRGTYDFEVTRATDEVSKAGNEMIKLQLKVYDASGNSQTVWDYLLESMQEKLLHACEALGLNDRYDSGLLNASDFEGKAGQLVLYIQKQNGYPDKNSVADYVRRAAPTQRPTASPPNSRKPVHAGGGSALEDEIPFAACWQ